MGLHTGHSAAGVGSATTRTVVLCSMLIILSDFVLTKAFVAVGWIAPVG
jgi:ABC-type transporter Mla maintaining outer membrane lipid asymmetry permease subunit MlaE